MIAIGCGAPTALGPTVPDTPIVDAPPARVTPVVEYGANLDPALRTRLEAQLPAAPATGDDFPAMRELLSPDAAFAFYSGQRAIEIVMGDPVTVRVYIDIPYNTMLDHALAALVNGMAETKRALRVGITMEKKALRIEAAFTLEQLIALLDEMAAGSVPVAL